MWLFLGVVASIAGILAYIDWRTRQLPNWLTLPLALAVVIVSLLPSADFLTPHMLVGGLLWWALPIALRLVSKQKMTAAAGDQKLGLTLGIMSVMNAAWGLLVAWLVAGLASIYFARCLNSSGSTQIAHGPGMVLGAACAWVVTLLVGGSM